MISYSLTINGVSYDCEIGALIKKDGTEELDSGTIEIKNTTVSSEFTEADQVILVAGTKTFKLIVQADRVEAVTETLYDHTLTLTEETAKLIKIYPVSRYYSLNGTSLFTHWEIMQREMATAKLGATFPYTVDSDTQTALGIVSPQKKFEGMNFYQRANDLMRGIKAVVRMEDDVITHSYYNEFNKVITLEDLIGWQKERDFNNYATTIVSDAKNITYDLDETTGATWWPSATTSATPRSSQGKYTDDTAQYQLGLDIRRIIKAELIDVSVTEISSSSTIQIDMDITPYVVSKEEWDGLELGSNSKTNIAAVGDVVQRNSIYYTIGSNTIEGMGIEYTDVGVDPTHMEVLILTWIAQNGASQYLYIAENIKDYKLRVQYQPYIEATITSEKWDISVDKVSEILNNQKDTTLDIGRYGPVMNTIANRLANGDWLVSINHTSASSIWELYDYTRDGYKVIKASYEFYPNEIIGTYQLSLRWVTLNGYQSVYKNTDPYTIGRDNVNANFRYREFLEFSTTNRGDDGSLTTQGKKTLWNIFDYASADDLQCDVGIFNSSEKTNLYGLDVMGTGGNAIRLITKLREPQNVGYELVTSGDDINKPCSYTDETGYMENFQMSYVDSYTVGSGDEDAFPRLPSVSYSSLVTLPTLTVHKNPNEIFGFNYELHPCTDEEGIYVYNDFSKFNNLVNDGQVTGLNVIVYDSDVQFDEMNTVPKSGGTTTAISSATIDKLFGYIDVSSIVGTNKTWAIGTTDKLFLAVNYIDSDRRRIYINNMKERTTTQTI